MSLYRYMCFNLRCASVWPVLNTRTDVFLLCFNCNEPLTRIDYERSPITAGEVLDIE